MPALPTPSIVRRRALIFRIERRKGVFYPKIGTWGTQHLSRINERPVAKATLIAVLHSGA